VRVVTEGLMGLTLRSGGNLCSEKERCIREGRHCLHGIKETRNSREKEHDE